MANVSRDPDPSVMHSGSLPVADLPASNSVSVGATDVREPNMPDPSNESADPVVESNADEPS